MEGEEDVMTAAQAKAVWLERELASLQQVLNRECSSQTLRGEYWSNPSKRWKVDALHPEGNHDDGRARGDRAYIGNVEVGDGRARGDRAGIGSFEVGDGRARGDRADAGNFEVGDGRARGDRAGIGNFDDGGCRARGDRAGIGNFNDGDGRARGDRACTGGLSVGDGRVQGERGSNFGVDEDKDNLKAVSITLPQLPPHSGQESGIACGDWLVQVRPLVGDMSAGALRWWDNVLGAVTRQYNKWLLADPLERLRLLPPLESDYNTTALCRRLDLRTSTLLLGSLPSGLKSELVAARHMSTGAILYRIMRNYQPGGLQEKSETLQALTLTQPGKSPRDATEKLQRWRRHQLRAQELCATLPDATILCKSLGVIVAEVLSTAPQESFRLNSFRLQSRLDVMPTSENLEQYYQMLLAEMETLSLNPENSGPANPSVKAMGTSSTMNSSLTSSSTSASPCRFWGSDAGCRQGKACKFAHGPLSDLRDRCWNCSSTQHRKAECPTRPGGAPSTETSSQMQTASGGSGGQGVGAGGKGKGKSSAKGGKGNGQREGRGNGGGGKGKWDGDKESPSVNKAQATEDKGKGTTTSASSTATGQEQPKEEIEKDDARSQSSTSQQRNTTAGSGEMNSESLVSEVTALLKSMRMQGPRLSAISIKRLERNTSRTTLLDGGATHCLRPTTSQQEWDSAQECTVALATGSVELKQVRDSGTLITQDTSTQRIIPIRELVRMGLKIVWKNEMIEMTWQDGSRLPVWLDGGCPVVDDKLGKDLMEQIEANNYRLAGIKKIWRYGNREAGEKQCDKESVEDAMELSRLFPEVPHWLIDRVPGAPTVDMSKVPFNRRQRKRLMEAKTRVLHLFSGEHTRMWMQMAEEGLAVVCIEIEKGTDFMDDNLYAFLMDMAKEGLWDLITGGPPCRTVSLQRYRDDGGPRPLRSREGVQRFGLSWNSFRQQEQCNHDSILWLRMVFLIYMGWKGNPKMETLIEQPSDPQIWLDQNRPRPPTGFASYLCWAETQSLMDMMQLREIHFDQGAVGHEHVKPTTLLSNCEEAKQLIALRADRRKAVEWSGALHERMEESKKAAKWAPGLVEVIYRMKEQSVDGPRPGAIRRHPGKFDAFLNNRRELRERHGLPPLPDERLAIRTLDVKQKRELLEWQHHIDNDHKPFRRDCEECLRSMGRDRMRKRITCPDSYVLNLDIMGPFNTGDDQTGTGFHYAMVGAFTVPCSSDDNPLVQGLLQMGGRVRHQEDDDEESGDQREDRTVRQQLEKQLKDMTEQHARNPPRAQQVLREEEEVIFDEEAQPPQDANPGEEQRESIPGEPDELKQLEDFLKELDEKLSPPTEVEVQAWDAMNRQWQDKVAHLKNVKVKTLTMAIPMKSRHTQEVLRAIALMHARLRSLNLPLIRCHTDRAREFVARPVQEWLRSHQVIQTVAAGDEPQGSGRVEREVLHLKEMTRLLMAVTQAPTRLWPLALRHASELRHRTQLRTMGVPQLQLIPFGTTCMAKMKRWHKREGEEGKWRYPMQKVRVWGPACDMSSSSQGYYVQAGDCWMRTTVIVIPKPKPLQLLKPQLPEVCPVEGVDDDASIAPSEEDPLAVLEESPHLSREQMESDTVQEQQPQQPEVFLVEPREQDLPPRRIHGKKNPDQLHPHYRSVRVLRHGGEWYGSDVGGEEMSQQGAMEECDSLEATRNFIALEQVRLRELRLLEMEEKAVLEDENGAHTVLQIRETCEETERRLKTLSEVEKNYEQLDQGEQTLITRPVSLDEVKRNIEEWKPALYDEYQSLINHGAIQPLAEDDYVKLKESCDEITAIPGMLVATLKPPAKKKARMVACGNYVKDDLTKQEVSAGGIDAIVVRTLISRAAVEDWSVGTADVKTAFLQAPRRQTPGKATVITPPAVWRDAGILRHGNAERWKVTGALYGLVESPKDWAIYRDAQLKRMSWSSEDGERFRMLPTPEAHLWKVCSASTGETRAFVGVYVDDILVVGPRSVMLQVMEDLKKVFYMSPFEEVTEEHTVTFCGYEIAKQKDGYALRQEKYVQDILTRREVVGEEQQPLPKICEGEDETEKDVAVIREVQAIVGELQWLASRTRADLAYATSLVARMVHRRPAYALGLCHYMLKYLKAYPDLGLDYGTSDDEKLKFDQMYIKADTSFALPHEQYRSVQGVAVFLGSHLLLWTSSRQAFITMSTGEAELLGYTEALQCCQSIGDLLLMMGVSTQKHLQGDSKAALCQLQADGGSWRTRHLRLRAWKLREVMSDPTSQWSSSHIPGSELAADGLTKALHGQAHRKFIGLLGLSRGEECASINMKKFLTKNDEAKNAENYTEDTIRKIENYSIALAGAGSALLIGSENRTTGALLLVCSLLLNWMKKRNDQEPKSQQKKNQGSKNQEWKKEERSGKGDIGSRSGSQEKLDIPHGLGSSAPGLRALRLSQTQSSSHGLNDDGESTAKGSTKGGKAERRGQEAMNLLQRAGSVGEPVTYAPSGYVGDPMARSSSFGVGQSAHVQGVLSTAPPQDDGGRQCPRVRGSLEKVQYPPDGSQPEAYQRYAEEVCELQQWQTEGGRDPTPQNKSKYLQRPRGKDRWDLSMVESGWLIRSHGESRKRKFHPVHKSCPLELERLGPQRVTVRFLDGIRKMEFDEWSGGTGDQRTADDLPWNGFTMFPLRLGQQVHHEATADDTRAISTLPSAGVSSDGSFEMVRDEP